MARIPKRNHRLVLESPVRTPDGGGGFALSWAEAGALWGEIEVRGAVEPALGDRPAARVTHRITLRAELGPGRRPEPGQRFRLGARIFAILGVAEGDPAGATLIVHAEEGPLS